METHQAWQDLVTNKSDAGGLSTSCVNVPNATNKLSVTEARAIIDAASEPGSAHPIDPKGKPLKPFYYHFQMVCLH